jgi:hypothetical protein
VSLFGLFVFVFSGAIRAPLSEMDDQDAGGVVTGLLQKFYLANVG